ncbi:MAG: phospholipase D-like domain-containing protein [Christensenellaceae bacterium]|jgi:superfamily II DNA or RNA helicase|nr:phospholipase D-like domain-containing protein [Christensenellaceae bacterium]
MPDQKYLIDNKEEPLVLKTVLNNWLDESIERVDILTAFFYFSGFNELATSLKDKEVRILVGKIIEPELLQAIEENILINDDENFDSFQVRDYSILNKENKKTKYIDGFVRLFNSTIVSSELDDEEKQEGFKIFLKKIEDGTLKIRLTELPHHGKAYILHKRNTNTIPGVVISGSSNFTKNGLLLQGELNIKFSDNMYFDQFANYFNKSWENSSNVDVSVDPNSKTEFISKIKNDIWFFSNPKPYYIFLRILHEIFNPTDSLCINSVSSVTKDKYLNLVYQTDAIKFGLNCVKKHNGVIIADVVGLGKSIIALAIAQHLDIKETIIITPPHMLSQWETFAKDFRLRNLAIRSSGIIPQICSELFETSGEKLFIIDEAHKYRNENTITYKYLHQLTRSHINNKVILLTATPYNNHPRDLFAQIKLFQNPTHDTFNFKQSSNFNEDFRAVINKYNNLKEEYKKESSDIKKLVLDEISEEIRNIIRPIFIRRSRLDLKNIDEYANDLERQNIKFPEIIGPKLWEYCLGSLNELYARTILDLHNTFKASIYTLHSYLIDSISFYEKYKKFLKESNFELIQNNIVDNIKRLLILRFESSKHAFKTSLTDLLKRYEDRIDTYKTKNYIEIECQKILDDFLPQDSSLENIDDIFDDEFKSNEYDDNNKTIKIDISFLSPKYLEDLEADRTLLKNIFLAWFDNNDNPDFDPKFDHVHSQIQNLFKENTNRKIVIFSMYIATVDYLYENLKKHNHAVIRFSGKSTTDEKDTVLKNFDAQKTNREDKYNILVTTDALSEGVNLNRANVVINYDIPYSPTRVIQRIGRLNRINNKIYDKIFIFNLFPSAIGEQNVSVKDISTFKMHIIEAAFGNDTKILTETEVLKSYFEKQYNELETQSEQNWDVEFRNIYNSIKNNSQLMEAIEKIPKRTRIVRKKNKENITISFATNSKNFVFASSDHSNNNTNFLPIEKALEYFRAKEDELGYDSDSALTLNLKLIKEKLSKDRKKKPTQKFKTYDLITKCQRKITIITNKGDYKKAYLNDLKDVIDHFNDLCDFELKFIINLNCSNVTKAIDMLIKNIPQKYLDNIRLKVTSATVQQPIIVFTEDLRNDNN